jgi:hypothetical protein
VVEVHAPERLGRLVRHPQAVGDGVVRPDHLDGRHRLDRGLRRDADQSRDNVAAYGLKFGIARADGREDRLGDRLVGQDRMEAEFGDVLFGDPLDRMAAGRRRGGGGGHEGPSEGDDLRSGVRAELGSDACGYSVGHRQQS